MGLNYGYNIIKFLKGNKAKFDDQENVLFIKIKTSHSCTRFQNI